MNQTAPGQDAEVLTTWLTDSVSHFVVHIKNDYCRTELERNVNTKRFLTHPFGDRQADSSMETDQPNSRTYNTALSKHALIASKNTH